MVVFLLCGEGEYEKNKNEKVVFLTLGERQRR